MEEAVEQALVGSYRVVLVEQTTPEGELRRPFGDEPAGYLLYGADSMMAALVGAADRPVLALDLLAGTVSAGDSELADAFRSASAFVGTYEVTGATIVHRILASTVANWVGTEQVRPFELDRDELTLRPPGWRVVGRRWRPGEGEGR